MSNIVSPLIRSCSKARGADQASNWRESFERGRSLLQSVESLGCCATDAKMTERSAKAGYLCVVRRSRSRRQWVAEDSAERLGVRVVAAGESWFLLCWRPLAGG